MKISRWRWRRSSDADWAYRARESMKTPSRFGSSNKKINKKSNNRAAFQILFDVFQIFSTCLQIFSSLQDVKGLVKTYKAIAKSLERCNH